MKKYNKNLGLLLTLLACISLGMFIGTLDIQADNASDLDYHSNVRVANAIADASSGVCVEVDAAGNLQMEDATVAADTSQISGDIADIEALLTTIDADTSSVSIDMAALEVLLTASNVDLAALEVLITNGNIDLQQVLAATNAATVDLAAIEVLLTAIDTDTNNVSIDTAANRALLITIDSDTADIATDTGNIATSTGNVSIDTAANRALLITIDSDTNDIKTAVEIIDDWDNTGSDACKVESASKTGLVATADTVVKGSAGTLFYYNVQFEGATRGDTVQFENAVSDGGTSLSTATMLVEDNSKTTGDYTIEMASTMAIAYATGLYCDATLTTGSVTVSIIYE